MTINEYQILAARTCPSLANSDLDLLHMQLGVNTEIGEALDALKKHIAYGKPLDLVNLQEEISDTVWYLVNQARLKHNELKIVEDPSLYHSDDYPFLAKGLMLLLADYNLKYRNESVTISQLLNLSKMYNLDFYKGLENNIKKLQIRYPSKFSTESALNRDLISERIELEK